MVFWMCNPAEDLGDFILHIETNWWHGEGAQLDSYPQPGCRSLSWFGTNWEQVKHWAQPTWSRGCGQRNASVMWNSEGKGHTILLLLSCRHSSWAVKIRQVTDPVHCNIHEDSLWPDMLSVSVHAHEKKNHVLRKCCHCSLQGSTLRAFYAGEEEAGAPQQHSTTSEFSE